MFSQQLHAQGKYQVASQRELTAADLQGKSSAELKIMRNEIFARYGYVFKTKDMKEYFGSQPWYRPSVADVTSKLTALEKKPVTLVKGSVLNGKTGKPLAAVVHYEDLESGKELVTVKSDPASGTYKIILPSGRRYGFYAETPGYFSENTNVDLTDQHEYKTTTQDLTVVPIESGQTVPIRNVFFETGKAQLAAESSLELNRLVPIIQRHSNFSLEISGHTDDVGTDENNKSLSDKRANAVLKYLTSKGVSANRVVAVGYGESKPLVPNDSEYNRSFNRRVEFTVR